MVLGKPGFAYLKAKIFGFYGKTFGRFAPAKEVGRMRYRIGLVMFMLPLVLGWVMPYVERLSPWVDRMDRRIDWVWDIVLSEERRGGKGGGSTGRSGGEGD